MSIKQLLITSWQGVIEKDFTITTNEDNECSCKEPNDISTTMDLL